MIRTAQVKRSFFYAIPFALLASMSAHATNGYFTIGYGPSSRGVAGAVTALPQDAMIAATNPAGMSEVGERIDFSVNLFSPIREATTNFGFFGPGSGFQQTQESDNDYFILPNFGYTKKINDQLTAGITIYANGGLNSEYQPDPNTGGFNLFGGTSQLGVDLKQLIFAPTLAYKPNKNHSFGASLLIAYQSFKALGLQNFCSLKGDGSCDPTNPATIGTEAANDGLTNQGTDTSWGAGLRLGWVGKVSDNVTLGAAYSTKVYMNEFDKYDRLFAEDGDFDIPANWSLGIAVKATPKLTITADVQHIDYDGVDSISNNGPSINGGGAAQNFINPFAEGQGFLGANNGLGFGWDSITVLKLGAVYEYDNEWTWRFGLSHGDGPIDDDQLAFNVLATAVVETHATVGFRHRPAGATDHEWNVAYMHAFNNDVRGPFPTPFGGTPGAGTQTRLEMYQHAFEVGYSWKF